MCCSVLQRAAVCEHAVMSANVAVDTSEATSNCYSRTWCRLQCVAVCCSVLQCVAANDNVGRSRNIKSDICAPDVYTDGRHNTHMNESYLEYGKISVDKRGFEFVFVQIAVCCRVLQCVAVCCSVLQCAAVWCSVMQCVAVCCSVLQCVAVYCGVVQCVAVCCSAL